MDRIWNSKIMFIVLAKSLYTCRAKPNEETTLEVILLGYGMCSNKIIRLSFE